MASYSRWSIEQSNRAAAAQMREQKEQMRAERQAQLEAEHERGRERFLQAQRQREAAAEKVDELWRAKNSQTLAGKGTPPTFKLATFGSCARRASSFTMLTSCDAPTRACSRV